MSYKSLFTLIFFLVIHLSFAEAKLVYQNGRLISSQVHSSQSFEQLKESFLHFQKEKNWNEAALHFERMVHNYGPQAYESLPAQSSAFFFMGIAHYLRGELETAVEQLNLYFSQSDPMQLTFFKEGMQYRFAVAEHYRKGVKRRPMGKDFLPRLFNGYSEALALYDEIITSLPYDPLANKAMFSKGLLFKQQRLFLEAVDTFKTLIHSASASPLALLAFQEISDVYLKMSEKNAESPYLLELAKLNCKKFQQFYPNDEKQLKNLEASLSSMEENYAKKLFQTGRFYERKSQPLAAVLYYYDALVHYPQTPSAKKSQNRLKGLSSFFQQLRLPKDVLEG